jgi:hypothetical protein
MSGVWKMSPASKIGLSVLLLLGVSTGSAWGQLAPAPAGGHNVAAGTAPAQIIAPQAEADGTGEARRLIAAARAATGGAAWDRLGVLHEHFSLTAGGIEGAAELWADPFHTRFALRYALGPDRGGEGWGEQGDWNLDWGGRVHRDDGADSSAARAGAIWQSFAFLFPERNGIAIHPAGRRSDGAGGMFQAVRLAPRGGSSIELWLDAHTALPHRLIVKGAPETVVSFEDYRAIGGLTLPGTIRVSSGWPKNDRVSVLRSAESETVPPDGDPFAAPAPGPADYHFPAGDTVTHVKLVPTGDAFMVEIMIEGKGPYRFALDTGAGNAIDTALAAELGLKPEGAFTAQGAGELPVDVALTRAQRVEIGEVTLDDQLFRVLPLSQIVAGDHPAYRGLLGYEFFDRFVVNINQDHKQAVLSEPQGWHFRGDADPVPFRFHGTTPVVEGEIDLVPGRFSLDTGQANSITLFRPFMHRMGIERKYLPKLTAIVGEGVGGPIRAGVTRAQKLILGRTPVSNPVLFLSLQKSGAFSDPELAGNVGFGVFARFSTTFDYAHRRVYFDPIWNFGIDDSLKLMVVKHSAFGLEVLSVLPGCPLAEAGLKRDDVIESIDLKDAARLDDPQLQRIFRRPAGTRVPMTIRSDGELKHIVVVLGETV